MGCKEKPCVSPRLGASALKKCKGDERGYSVTRRDFLSAAAAFAAAPAFAKKPEEIRGVLLHWGHNMWGESLPEGVKKIKNGRLANDHLKFDETLWRRCVDRMVLRKMNLVVIDLGEFPVYPSHPEPLVVQSAVLHPHRPYSS